MPVRLPSLVAKSVEPVSVVEAVDSPEAIEVVPSVEAETAARIEALCGLFGLLSAGLTRRFIALLENVEEMIVFKSKKSSSSPPSILASRMGYRNAATPAQRER